MFTFTKCNSNIKKKINLTPLVNAYNASLSTKKMHPVLQSYKVRESNYKRAIKLKQYSTPLVMNTAVNTNKSGGNVVLSYSNSNNNDNKTHKRIKSNQVCINIKINNNSVKHLNCVNYNGYNRRYNYNYRNVFSQDHLPIINNKHTILISNTTSQGNGNSNNSKRNHSRNNKNNNNSKQRHKGMEIENSFISEIQSIIDDNTHTNTNNNELHIIYSKKRDIINTNRPTTSYAHIKLKNNLRTKSLSPN